MATKKNTEEKLKKSVEEKMYMTVDSHGNIDYIKAKDTSEAQEKIGNLLSKRGLIPGKNLIGFSEVTP